MTDDLIEIDEPEQLPLPLDDPSEVKEVLEDEYDDDDEEDDFDNEDDDEEEPVD